MPNKILTDIFNEHIPYEIDMLRETYRMLAATPPPTDARKNALIEAFCVHARSLLDFFMCEGFKPDDVIASDFVTGFTPQLNDTVEPLKTIRVKLNKQIFHLTKDRTIVDADKFDPDRDGSEVVNRLEKEIGRFATACVGSKFGQLNCNTQPIPFICAPPVIQPSSQSTITTTFPVAGATATIGPRRFGVERVVSFFVGPVSLVISGPLAVLTPLGQEPQ
jgi:hypothetical protein